MDYPRFVVTVSASGLLITLIPMLACWVIGERVAFLLQHLKRRDPLHRAMLEVVGTKFPPGGFLILHVLPLCWTWTWILLLVGEFAGAWTKR
ncbi:MAG: hypothetical protein DYG92_11845 [Leptolyngbya sp. PLA1]|nr:hypothetical protein [Leptolyngbya sp. PLA1]